MNKSESFKKYRIFVVCHEKIYPEYYLESQLKNLVFINVREGKITEDERFTVINIHDLKHFTSLGHQYAESEVIFNVYNNSEVYEDVDYVGFVHYDMDMSMIDISDTLNETDASLILFQPYKFRQDYKLKMLMDYSQPDKWIGNGVGCYETIFNDYNKFYGKSHLTKNYNDEIIGLCSSFLVEKDIFHEMMSYIGEIIKSGKLDIFDKTRKIRMQGGLLERYYASWFLLSNKKQVIQELEHKFQSTREILEFQKWEQRYSVKSIIKKLIRTMKLNFDKST